MIEQNTDSRLNPRLHKSCKLDMKKFCPSVAPGQGRILGCLKNVYINPKNRLTDTCKAYIEEILEHAAKEDVKYDADLYSSCTIYVSSYIIYRYRNRIISECVCRVVGQTFILRQNMLFVTYITLIYR